MTSRPPPDLSALGPWYDRQARDLPWRRVPSAYRTVVSEFMLQQTQVATVLPYFDRWTARWPDFTSLATATEDDVLKAWEGLGYYSRARRLHALARAVSQLPQLPRTAAEWATLPGVGPYTAAAIASIAFGEPVAVTDGNVVRVLARLVGDATPYRDSGTASRALAPLAEAVLDRANPGRHNQAMMELGALVCRPRSPTCLVCPVHAACEAARRGTPKAFPVLLPKTWREAAVTRVWLERDGHLLLHVAPEDSRRLARVAELPTPAQAGLPAEAPLHVLAVHRRTIAQTRYTETIATPTVAMEPACEADAGLIWARLPDLPGVTVSGPHRRWIQALCRERP